MDSVGIEHNRNAIRLVDAAAGCSGLALGVQVGRHTAPHTCACPSAEAIVWLAQPPVTNTLPPFSASAGSA
jgi:hypothetical protein